MTGAEVTSVLVQEHHLPSTVRYGSSPKRLTLLYVDCTSARVQDFLTLSNYVPGISGILAIESSSEGGADASNGTVNTWSGSKLTFVGHTSGTWNLTILAYY